MTDPFAALAFPVLQVGELSAVELVLLASDYVTIALGLVIAYVAFRGYDRNDSRPMLVIAAGFVLVFGGPGLISALLLVPAVPPVVTGALTQAVELLGMLTILYGFWMPGD